MVCVEPSSRFDFTDVQSAKPEITAFLSISGNKYERVSCSELKRHGKTHRVDTGSPAGVSLDRSKSTHRSGGEDDACRSFLPRRILETSTDAQFDSDPFHESNRNSVLVNRRDDERD